MANAPSPSKHTTDHVVNIPQSKTHVKYTGIRAKTNEHRLHSRLIGFVCVVICIVAWISMAEIEPLLFAHSFQKPYFLNYIATCSLMTMIIPYLILHTVDTVRTKLRDNKRRIITEFTSINSFTNRFANYRTMQLTTNRLRLPDVPPIHSQYKKLLIPSITVSLLYFSNNYLWFISLYYTIAAVNNTIYQSQCIFVLIFSVVMLKKKPTKYNIMSVISSIIGVALISLLGREHEDNSSVQPDLFGILSCLSAALIYALFQVQMNAIEQQYFDQTNNYNKFKNMLFFQFMMGANIAVLTWPGFLILNYVGVESFVFPLNGNEWISIMILSTFTITYCITYIIGICFSGALFMSIGTLLVIPFTYVVDIWLYQLVITPVSVIGSCFVIIGFVLMQQKRSESNETPKVDEQEEAIPITQEDKEQIVSHLASDLDGASIIEITNGCSEFTEHLASKASTMLVVHDNSQDVETDKYPHIDYLCCDATQLDLDCESYDFVFTRYQMKHLTHSQMHKLAQNYCNWLTRGGYLCIMHDKAGFMKILDDEMHDLNRISVHKLANTNYFLYKKD
eukprot:103304_1